MKRSSTLLMLAGTPLAYKLLPFNIHGRTRVDMSRQGEEIVNHSSFSVKGKGLKAFVITGL